MLVVNFTEVKCQQDCLALSNSAFGRTFKYLLLKEAKGACFRAEQGWCRGPWSRLNQPAARGGFRGGVTNQGGCSEAAVSVSMGTEIGSSQKAR